MDTCRKYPDVYTGPKPIEEQVGLLAKIFDLSPHHANLFIRNQLPKMALPEGAEGWFAIPSIYALSRGSATSGRQIDSDAFCRAWQFVLEKMSESRPVVVYRYHELTPHSFQLCGRTERAYSLLAEQQKGDIWIVAGQFGKRYAGCSVVSAAGKFGDCEFGADITATGAMLLVHPERLVSYDDLRVNTAGDTVQLPNDTWFSPGSPLFFIFWDKKLWVDANPVERERETYGPVTLFATKKLN